MKATDLKSTIQNNRFFHWVATVIRENTLNRIRRIREVFPTIIPLLGKFRSRQGQHPFTENGKVFVTYRVRPIRSQQVDNFQVFKTNSDTAIIVQGPIMKEFSFTFETIKLYTRIFPGSPIILSTWKNESKDILDAIETLGAHVVTSDLPPPGGVGSHNLQMISSHAGVVLSQTLGAKFLLKTRTDQRIHNPLAITLMKGLLDYFPLSEHASQNQVSRLAVISFSSFAYRLFGLSDMLHFGKSEDIFKYWNGSLDSRDSVDLSKPHPSIVELATRNIAETYYMTNFLRGTSWNVELTLDNYWAACRDRFIIVDAASLDLYWPKRSIQEDRWKNYSYPITHQEMDFAFWISLRDKIEYDSRIMKISEKELGFPLLWETDISRYH